MGLTFLGGITFTGGVELIASSTPPTPGEFPWLQLVFDIYPIDIGGLNSKELAQTIVFGDN